LIKLVDEGKSPFKHLIHLEFLDIEQALIMQLVAPEVPYFEARHVIIQMFKCALLEQGYTYKDAAMRDNCLVSLAGCANYPYVGQFQSELTRMDRARSVQEYLNLIVQQRVEAITWPQVTEAWGLARNVYQWAIDMMALKDSKEDSNG